MRKILLINCIFFVSIFLGVSRSKADMGSSNFSIKGDSLDSSSLSGDPGALNSSQPNRNIADGSSYSFSTDFWALVGANPVLSFNLVPKRVELGTLAKSATKYDTASFGAATTSKNGYAIQLVGDVPSFSGYSTAGVDQFGVNLAANDNPQVGADPVGGRGLAGSDYDKPNRYKFNSGDIIAESSRPSDFTYYTMSFIGNTSSQDNAENYKANLAIVVTGRY